MLLWCSLISSHRLCHEAAHGLCGFVLLLTGGVGVGAESEPRIVVSQHIKPCAALLSVGVNSFSYRMGPTITDVHTPRERLDAASADTVWQCLCRVLEMLAAEGR